MSALRLPLACFVLLALAAAPARADHIVNGSFPSNMLNWELFTAEFTATTTTTNVAVFNGDSANKNNAALDNITLNSAAVPEPPPASHSWRSAWSPWGSCSHPEERERAIR
jgi:hypothetical protein